MRLGHRSAALFAALVIGSLAPLTANAQLTVLPDATTIHETDSLDIEVQAVGVNVGTPDFSPFERDFEILSTRSSSQYQSVNGRVEAWTRWTLTAKPRRTGRLELPALQLNGHRSAPVEILVKALDSRAREIIDATVFFEVEATPQPVYVQAQLVFVRRLFYADGAQLYGDIPAAPEVPDAIVQSIGEPRSDTANRNGRRYGVIEQRFAIFPERSGRLTIPAVTVTGSVRLPAQSGSRRRTGVRVRSEPLEVTVLPIPADYPPEAPWLPAQRVEILEVWDAGKTLPLGTPVQRSLMVRAEGTVASIIPPLDMALPDSMRGYPDPPELRDATQDNTLVGTRIEAMSLVPGQPGAVELPAVPLTWFDTVDQTVRTAQLDARHVNIVGSQARETPVVDGGIDAAAPVLRATQTERQPSPTPIATHRPTLAHALGALLAFAIIGWAFTGWRLYQVRRKASRRAQSATQTDRDAADERTAFRALTTALESNDIHAVKNALTQWAIAFFDCAPDRTSVVLRAADPDLAVALDHLNAMLYAPAATAGTDLDSATRAALSQSVARVRKSAATAGTSTDSATSLAPLYPS